jgi:hypothetical protein
VRIEAAVGDWESSELKTMCSRGRAFWKLSFFCVLVPLLLNTWA